MGIDIAQTGKYDATTMSVKEYDHELNGIKFTIIDTPGLCDDLPEKGNDQKYIELIQSKVDRLDCIWFVTRLDEPRVTADEIRGIKIISEAFTPEVWEHSIIIFTRADKADNFEEDLRERTKRIHSEISKYVSPTISSAIPSVAVANGHEHTPDGRKWLGELWTKVFVRIQQQGAIPFLVSTIGRLNYGSTAQQTPPQSKSVYRIKFRESSKSTNKDQEDPNNQEDHESHQKSKVDFSDDQVKEVKKRLFDIVPVLKSVGKAIGSVVGLLAGGSSGQAIGREIGIEVGGAVGKVIEFAFSLF